MYFPPQQRLGRYLVTIRALITNKFSVVGRRWHRLSIRVVAQHTVPQPLQRMWNLRSGAEDRVCRLNESLRRMTILARCIKVVGWWLVTGSALKDQIKSGIVTRLAVQRSVLPLQGYRMLKTSQIRLFEPFRRVTFFTPLAKVRLRGRLMTLSAIEGQVQASTVARKAFKSSVLPLQRYRMLESPHICWFEP